MTDAVVIALIAATPPSLVALFSLRRYRTTRREMTRTRTECDRELVDAKRKVAMLQKFVLELLHGDDEA